MSLEISSKINDVFIPSSPVVDESQCFGRSKEIDSIFKNLNIPGKHVILFGGRGFGKTSISNIVSKKLKPFHIVKINCYRSQEKFDNVCRDILKKLKDQIDLGEGKDFDQGFKSLLEKVLSSSKITHVQLISLFKKSSIPILIILDEADLLSKEDANLANFTDLIKAMSDQVPMVKFLIIGIAESSHEFIGEHSSLERCITEVRIDRMNRKDLEDILDGGLIKLKMNMTPEVKENIISFSQGLPYYVHLLCFYAVEDAWQLNYKTVVKKNYIQAVHQAIFNMEENLKGFFKKAIGHSKGDTIKNVLESCILIVEKEMSDEYQVTKNDDSSPRNFNQVFLSAKKTTDFIKKKNRDFDSDEKKVLRVMGVLCEEKKGQFLAKIKKNPPAFYLTHPLFNAYIHYLIYQRGEISEPVFFLS